MWLGFLYLLLTIISSVYWVQGFEAYLCLTKACLYFTDIFGRSMLLWGILYYTIAAAAIFAGWLRKRRLLIFVFLLGGLAGHFLFLGLAWRATGFLCSTCTALFTAELILLVLAWLYKPTGSLKWGAQISGAAAVLVLILLVVNPNFSTETVLKPFSSQAEQVPLGLAEGGRFTVTTTEGDKVQLDLKERSALIWAWWCPNCQKELERLVRLPESERPYLVLAGIENITDDLAKAKAKLQKVGLEKANIYLLTEPVPLGLPTLLFWDSTTQKVRMH